MKIARLGLPQGPRYAVLDEEKNHYVLLADDPMFGSVEATGQTIPSDEARLVAPMLPRSKVLGLGGSYGPAPLEELPLFVKPNTSVIGPEDPIVIPRWAPRFSYEAEIAVVISRVAKDVPVARADDVIFGYTLTNDVTIQDVQGARAKIFDTSCPLGPVINTGKDYGDLELTLSIDGERVGTESTASLTHTIPEIVSYLSSICTLLPGDVILTGAAIKAPGAFGQHVEMTLESVGAIANRVVADEE